MPKTAPYSSTAPTLKTGELKRFADGWLLDGEVRQLSPRTQDSRQRLIRKLLWFLGEKGLTSCGKPELRAFLAYVSRGHEDPGGRWGNPRMDRPVKPGTST